MPAVHDECYITRELSSSVLSKFDVYSQQRTLGSLTSGSHGMFPGTLLSLQSHSTNSAPQVKVGSVGKVLLVLEVGYQLACCCHDSFVGYREDRGVEGRRRDCLW